jgi:Haem-dependent oxidative N-demethylase, alpha subunit-like
MEPQWHSLFPETGFRWQMSLRPGDGRQFFSPSPDHESLLRERKRWLTTHPREFTAALPESASLVEEVVGMVSRWLDENARPQHVRKITDAEALCFAGGIKWEPDWVLLRQDAEGAFRLVAGVVCFPSMWSLREKLGRTIAEIHEPVAGLNASLGAKIDTFLARVRPEQDWERENWGLNGSYLRACQKLTVFSLVSASSIFPSPKSLRCPGCVRASPTPSTRCPKMFRHTKASTPHGRD